jgi:hypothetical protein
MTTRWAAIARLGLAAALCSGCAVERSHAAGVATAEFPRPWDETLARAEGPRRSSDAPVAPALPAQAAAPQPMTPPPLAAMPAAPANAPLEDIALRDGTVLRARIVERKPGEWLVVETPDGGRRILAQSALRAEAAPARTGQVVLTDGTVRKGKITKQELGSYVILVDEEGVEHSIPWNTIREVTTDRP